MSVSRTIPYPQFYRMTSISYDKALELVNEKKLKASFLNGELFINVRSMEAYIEALPKDNYSREHFEIYGRGK
jgi:hypothetical protein